MKLEIALLAGAETKAFLADFAKQLDRLERLGGVPRSGATALAAAQAEDAGDASDEDDFGGAPAKPAKAAAAAKGGFDDEAETGAEAEAEEEDFTAPPAKAAKPKKITLDDVNDACKAKAASIGGKPGRAKVLEMLKKNFKTESVSELKPEQYAKCVQLMAVS